MTAPRLTMIGVGNLMEVIWPVLQRNLGGDDVADRVIGVTADAPDLARKQAHFGFEIVLDDNLGALRRNRPDIILFAPPPTVAPDLITSVLRPYYDQRRAEGGPLPDLYAFPPVPSGAAYLEALGNDVLVVNIIPNNVTTIAGQPVEDEGYYVCTFPAPWPTERVAALRAAFQGQGAHVELAPGQLIPMLGAAATVSSLWHAVPLMADLVGADHRSAGRFLRARLAGGPDTDRADEPEPPGAEILAAAIDGWRTGVERYHAETDLDPAVAATLRQRGFDLTLHTIAAEPRQVLVGHSVGAATKGGVLERAIRAVDEELLPAISTLVEGGVDDPVAHIAQLVASTCRTVRDHGHTLAS